VEINERINAHEPRPSLSQLKSNATQIMPWLPGVTDDAFEIAKKIKSYAKILKQQTFHLVNLRDEGMEPSLKSWDIKKTQVFNLGLAMLHAGNWMVTMGSGGSDDPWTTKANAIYLLLNGDGGTKIAEDVLERHGGLGFGGGRGSRGPRSV
jgi:hypothetical protein